MVGQLVESHGDDKDDVVSRSRDLRTLDALRTGQTRFPGTPENYQKYGTGQPPVAVARRAGQSDGADGGHVLGAGGDTFVPSGTPQNSTSTSSIARSVQWQLIGNVTGVENESQRGENLVYGHIHIAKTAGSTINRKFSLFFDNVCGNKGHSFDAIRVHDRHRRGGRGDVKSNHSAHSHFFHSQAQVRPSFLQKRMDEIGYEHCDWISHEISWQFWRKFSSWPAKVQIHLPCRDPVDHIVSHIMSVLNHQKKRFQCDRTWKRQIDSAMRSYSNRFSKQMLKIDNLDLKCVRFHHLIDGTYFKFMQSKLQERRVKRPITRLYYHTNIKRNEKAECVWNDKKLLQNMTAYMISKGDYYNFCSSCSAWLI